MSLDLLFPTQKNIQCKHFFSPFQLTYSSSDISLCWWYDYRKDFSWWFVPEPPYSENWVMVMTLSFYANEAICDELLLICLLITQHNNLETMWITTIKTEAAKFAKEKILCHGQNFALTVFCQRPSVTGYQMKWVTASQTLPLQIYFRAKVSFPFWMLVLICRNK